MKALLKRNPTDDKNIVTGLFSKKEGAKLISKGQRHIHSSILGKRDPCAKITLQRLNEGMETPYPWEPKEPAQAISLVSSNERHSLISQITNDPKLKSKRGLREKTRIVLEEMITNSLYHAFHKSSGEEKYQRSQPVSLVASQEILLVRYQVTLDGVFLEVNDHGGTLKFKDIASALNRCYGNSKEQIENKESGAGLGLFMIFEASTHLKFECTSFKETKCSCWLSDQRNNDANTFSFNFFRKE